MVIEEKHRDVLAKMFPVEVQSLYQVSYLHHIKVTIFKHPACKLTGMNKAILQVKHVSSTHCQHIVQTVKHLHPFHPSSLPLWLLLRLYLILNYSVNITDFPLEKKSPQVLRELTETVKEKRRLTNTNQRGDFFLTESIEKIKDYFKHGWDESFDNE